MIQFDKYTALYIEPFNARENIIFSKSVDTRRKPIIGPMFFELNWVLFQQHKQHQYSIVHIFVKENTFLGKHTIIDVLCQIL